MDAVRKFRKGDKLKVVGDREKVEESTRVYIVINDQTESGTVRVRLIEQADIPGKMKWSTSPQKIDARSLRRWEHIEEGPAKRPNNRVTKVKAVDVRLGETVRHDGIEFKVKRIEASNGVRYLYGEEKVVVLAIDGTADLEVLGARGRAMPKTVHFNQFTEEGLLIIQYNSRPGFGSFACGVVTNIDVFASSKDLVTCEQKCGEECQEHHWRKATKKI